MADEAVTTTTETSAPTETATETAATNDAAPVETSALGGAGDTAAAGEADKAAAEAATKDGADKGEGGDTKEVEAAKADVPEAYDLAAPEGFTIDAKDVELATPVLKEIGLSNEAANKLVPVMAQVVQNRFDALQAQQLQQVADWRKERFEEARNDPEIGGAKWDESIALAAKALDQFGAPKGSPFRNALDESGWGNHVEMVRMFTKIGRAIGEDTFTRADAGAPVKDTATVLYPNDTPKAGA